MKADATLPIPAAALLDCGAILGRRGSGKSVTMRVLFEAELDAGHRAVLIDPKGDSFGIRMKPDGKPSRFKVAILGGEHPDAPLDEDMGTLVGETIAKHDLSCILDLSGFTLAGQHRFMQAFGTALLKHNRAPLTLFIDEADQFAPQSTKIAPPMLLHIMGNLLKLGRQKGIIVWMISQRSANLSKTLLSQVDTLVAMKQTAPRDIAVMREWMDGHSSEAAKTVGDGISKLKPGEAFVWVAGEDYLERVQFPMHSTFDSGRAPRPGEALVDVKLEPIKLGALQSMLAPAPSEDPAPTKESTPNAAAVRRAAAIEAENVDLRRRLAEMKESYETAAQTADVLWSAVRSAREGLKSLTTALETKIATLASPALNERPAVETAAGPRPIPVPPPVVSQRPASPAPADAPRPAPAISASDNPDAPKGRPLAVLGILDEAIDQHPKMRERGVKEKTWAFLAGVDPKTSTWRGYKAVLRPFFVQNGDRCSLTPAGQALFDGKRGSTRSAVDVGDQLVRNFAQTVKPAGAGAILAHLLEIWPRSASREAMAAVTDADMRSSTFRGYLAPLNKLELIEKDGDGYRLARELMEW